MLDFDSTSFFMTKISKKKIALKLKLSEKTVEG